MSVGFCDGRPALRAGDVRRTTAIVYNTYLHSYLFTTFPSILNWRLCELDGKLYTVQGVKASSPGIFARTKVKSRGCHSSHEQSSRSVHDAILCVTLSLETVQG